MAHTVENVSSWELETVKAHDPLIAALEVMFENDYTQLGIEKDGEVIGIVSYRSISRVLSILRRLGVDKDLPGRKVEIAIEEVSPVVKPSDDLTVLFDRLMKSPYVIVEVSDEHRFEILTNYDLLQYLRDSIEPFLLIEDIERATRRIIAHAFGDDLEDAIRECFADSNIRAPDNLSDCSFGHYPQLMRANWPKLEDYFEHDGDFVGRILREVGDIRNKIFHFRADTYDSNVERELLKFAHGYFQRRIPDTLPE